ncbi:hypothetical protein DL98DRAFT_515655 [Cadophora sp. DSE1049]|nr:hypothetical protein DL98DRAFT_515655 [Cadophora sp. DSE1049]
MATLVFITEAQLQELVDPDLQEFVDFDEPPPPPYDLRATHYQSNTILNLNMSANKFFSTDLSWFLKNYGRSDTPTQGKVDAVFVWFASIATSVALTVMSAFVWFASSATSVALTVKSAFVWFASSATAVALTVKSVFVWFASSATSVALTIKSAFSAATRFGFFGLGLCFLTVWGVMYSVHTSGCSVIFYLKLLNKA